MNGWNGAFDVQNQFRPPQELIEFEGLPASVRRGRIAEPSVDAAQVHSFKKNLTGHVKSAGFLSIAQAAAVDAIDFFFLSFFFFLRRNHLKSQKPNPARGARD